MGVRNMRSYGKVLRSHLLVSSLAVGVPAGFAFLAFPDMDLSASRIFYVGAARSSASRWAG